MINYECGDKLVKLSSTYMAMMPQGLLDTAVGKKAGFVLLLLLPHILTQRFSISPFSLSQYLNILKVTPEYCCNNVVCLFSIFALDI